MFTKSLASIFVLAASVVADYSITQPVDGTVWKSGNKITITWLVNDSPPATPAKIDIALMSGPPEALQVKTVIASGVSSADGKYEWTVPANMENGQNYVVRAGNGPDVKYSHFFNVAGGGGASASPVPSGNSTQTPASSSGTSTASTSSTPSSSSQSTKSSPSSSASTSAATSKASASSIPSSAVNSAPTKSATPIKAPSGSNQLSASVMLAAIPAAIMAYLRS
ncbi:hypothetical protein K493DRAFT_301827 [Basidiobolus meristosporus CBS 931.73]|uniref:Yeast cell wall synthesis Kre9/Knh1-like N-terminal domain-containing protein n=1 Tax=Basidiobolus meristosporus CBS 931.73 TaxID=1314790 RepID=A0A1Y1YA59_9FUNG|nr:hypothetical protein K493DRAFT_301827 [Basidiobolus meristosporus CBS 931.73]|eukprot:ORX94842.1 hypothetical protein K493DRAFT_301827 [Basidiobolus meristosporus CBS 931.73]